MDKLQMIIRDFLKELEENGFGKYNITVNTIQKNFMQVSPGVYMEGNKLYFNQSHCTKIVDFCLLDDKECYLCSFFGLYSLKYLLASRNKKSDRKRIQKLFTVIDKYGVIDTSYTFQ